jgi:hypothetical protein
MNPVPSRILKVSRAFRASASLSLHIRAELR